MTIFRYSEWDGTQNIFSMDADELMDKVGQEFMNNGNLSDILRNLRRRGMSDQQGRRLPGLQEMLQRLRQKRQGQLDKYQLSSIMDEIRERLDNILKTEREGIQGQLDKARGKSQEGQEGQQGQEERKGQEGQEGADDMTPEMRERLNQLRQQAREARQGAGEEDQAGSRNLSPEMQQKLRQNLEERARQNLEKLDQLPKDVGGQIKELTEYDFMDEEARRQFQELMEMLMKNAMESYGRDLMQSIQNIDPNTMAEIRNLLQAINQMLEQRMNGQEPDFNQFMEQFGHFFGDNPPQNLDELMERLQEQIAQGRSLLNSLSPRDRQALQDLLESMLDDATKQELAKLARNLETLFPSDELQRRYPFSGEESISFSEALKLMESLQKMDKLEEQFREAQHDQTLDAINEKLIKELMGEDAARELEQLRELAKLLEEAGYIRLKDGQYELTPQGMRRIGQKALQDIFAQLRKEGSSGHTLKLKGKGGEKVEETKKYEFGDDFDLDFQKTLMNSLFREPQKPPLKLAVDDFEITQWQAATRTSIVLILDLSLSMFMRNYFNAAKRTAIALDTLIRSQYPKDSLHIIGFSAYARLVQKEDLFYIGQNRYEHGTNIQHALSLARTILGKERSANKQIILISDGEPTAHIEGGEIYFQYPPTLRTLQLTLREVRNCTQKGIVINTFMLDDSLFLSSFVTRMASMNKGRVFFADANNLGKYVLVDYIARKKKIID